MPRQNKIGIGTWIDKLAHEMIQREKSLNRDTSLLYVESGLGASGIPHVGSVGDAVRAYGVKLALENMGYNSKLIAYSDDMDGLRKVPDGFPDTLKEHLGKPVSYIPDNMGCHDSFGQHMSSLLLEGLDMLGIKYEFRSAKESYIKQLFLKEIHTILTNSKKIGDGIEKLVGQDKFTQRLPYFAVCENCNKLYTTSVHDYLSEEKIVQYVCQNTESGGNLIQGCGHHGESKIDKDLGKLSWKVEFAARWKAFDIRFEAFGKDIMDSVRVNDWISDEILNYSPPFHIKYEMFLDKGGKKISKSLGNVLTTQKWLRYGTAQSLLLLLFKRIKGARELGFEDIPSLMDEYDEIENIYFGKTKLNNIDKETSTRGLYEYIHLCNPPSTISAHTSYRLLVELCKIFKTDREKYVLDKLISYGMIQKTSLDVLEKINLAGNFVDDFDEQTSIKIVIDDTTKSALLKLIDVLNRSDLKDLQNEIYMIAKTSDIQPRDFFKILYQILLGSSKGPKIGPFINDIGTSRVAKMIGDSI